MTLKISFLVFLHNLLFENMLINLAEKESPRHVSATAALQVGILDHHSLTITALKSQLVKGNAKPKLYGDYSEFNMDNLKVELGDKLKSGVVREYSSFQNIIQDLINHAPGKKKCV